MLKYHKTLPGSAIWSIPLILALAFCAWWAGSQIRDANRAANRAADYSAHSALTKEICEQLAAWPAGKPYPESLADLALSFPDGGDCSLLERFEYRSIGTSCTVKTELVWSETDRQMIVHSYPADANAPWIRQAN
jgi:hypothetical protein